MLSGSASADFEIQRPANFIAQARNSSHNESAPHRSWARRPAMRFLKIFGFTGKRPQSEELDSSDKGPSDAGQQDATKVAQATLVREPSLGSTARDLETVPSEPISQGR